MDISNLLDNFISQQNSGQSQSSGDNSNDTTQLMQMISACGNELQDILTAKSKAEMQIAQIKAQQNATSNAMLQQQYQNQIDQMNAILNLILQKKAAATATKKDSNTGLYIGLGVGAVVILGLFGYIALKK